MYRTSSPRYKQSTRERRPRHDQSREPSETSSEEEEHSTDRYTEESDDTFGSQESESFQRESDCSAAGGEVGQRGTYTKLNGPENFVRNAYIGNTRILKQDKVTQKNLLSPFPSFTIPPVYKEVTGPPIYRVSAVRPVRERGIEVRDPGKPPRHSPKRRNYEGDEESGCHAHCGRSRKGCDKQRERPRCERSERIMTCTQGGQLLESSGKLAKPPGSPDAEGSLRTLPQMPETARRARTADREQASPDWGRPGRKTAVGTCPSEREPTAARDDSPGKCKRSRKAAGAGEVREKLVYVVEEKGKDVTKLETDLFTLNEILTIKKDLLELSEFAKKLKKLKETKRESENGKNRESFCHCTTAAELLKDVNRRIGALEARQEELERGSKSDQKGETESDSKKTIGQKTSSESQSKTRVMPKPSAMTTVLSFPKMEMFVSGGEDFSDNSDIVNELMDIKTQLQKLEKKRMSKEASEDVLLPEDSKPAKKDDHAIAVFSSRTYILTENFDKKNVEKKASEEENTNSCFPPVEGKTGREKTKEHVANWLRNVLPRGEENDANVSLATIGTGREENATRGNDFKCRNCCQVLKEDDFENQARLLEFS